MLYRRLTSSSGFDSPLFGRRLRLGSLSSRLVVRLRSSTGLSERLDSRRVVSRLSCLLDSRLPRRTTSRLDIEWSLLGLSLLGLSLPELSLLGLSRVGPLRLSSFDSDRLRVGSERRDSELSRAVLATFRFAPPTSG